MVSAGDRVQGSETLAVDKRDRQLCVLQLGLAKVGNGSKAPVRPTPSTGCYPKRLVTVGQRQLMAQLDGMMAAAI